MDAAIPMRAILSDQSNYDAVVFLTGRYTNFAGVAELIRPYRQTVNVEARFAFAAFGKKRFEVDAHGDSDLDNLVVCGFDAQAPSVLIHFASKDF